MERIMKAQALRTSNDMGFMAPKKTMELNPDSDIIQALAAKDPSDPVVKDLVWLLYDTSLLTSGFSLDQPTTFSSRIHHLIGLGLGMEDGGEEVDEMDDLPPLEEDGDDEGEATGTMEEVD